MGRAKKIFWICGTVSLCGGVVVPPQQKKQAPALIKKMFLLGGARILCAFGARACLARGSRPPARACIPAHRFAQSLRFYCAKAQSKNGAKIQSRRLLRSSSLSSTPFSRLPPALKQHNIKGLSRVRVFFLAVPLGLPAPPLRWLRSFPCSKPPKNPHPSTPHDRAV